VTHAGWDVTGGTAPENKGYGLSVRIDHGNGTHALYGHLATVFVRIGQTVGRWQPIGAIGDSGNSSGRHLHFTAYKDTASGGRFAFDPFGWNKSYGYGYQPPGYEDPHRGNGWSERKLMPGGSSGGCPLFCQEYWVDNDSGAPRVTFSCPPDSPGCGWTTARPSVYPNYLNHARVAAAGGSKTAWAVYRCLDGMLRPCPAGRYAVYASNPRGASRSRVVRYEPLGAAPGAVSAMAQNDDQHAGMWVEVGIFDFSVAPAIEISNRSDGYGIEPSGGEFIQADTIKFQRLCAAGEEGGTTDPSGTP
jgi:hypothetical protein